MNNSTVLRQIRTALRKGENLSDEQVAKLAELRRLDNIGKRFVGVTDVKKLELREGEELMDFVWTMMGAVQTDRIILADGSLDAWLVGIFNDHIVVEDGNTGRLFRADFTRNEKGEIAFSEPIEVRQVFVPVERPKEDEGGEKEEKAISKAAGERFEQIVEVAKSAANSGKWAGLLPSSLRRRR
jgi:hypothetical protein